MLPTVPKTMAIGSRAVPLKLANSYLLVSAVLNHTESVLLLPAVEYRYYACPLIP